MKPIVMPQINPTWSAPFVRGYPTDLKSIPAEDFLAFVDHLNGLIVQSPPLMVVAVVGGVLSCVPEPITMGVGTGLVVGATVSDRIRSHHQTDAFIKEANETLFKPAGFCVRLYKTDAALALLNLGSSDQSAQSVSEALIHAQEQASWKPFSGPTDPSKKASSLQSLYRPFGDAVQPITLVQNDTRPAKTWDKVQRAGVQYAKFQRNRKAAQNAKQLLQVEQSGVTGAEWEEALATYSKKTGMAIEGVDPAMAQSTGKGLGGGPMVLIKAVLPMAIPGGGTTGPKTLWLVILPLSEDNVRDLENISSDTSAPAELPEDGKEQLVSQENHPIIGGDAYAPTSQPEFVRTKPNSGEITSSHPLDRLITTSGGGRAGLGDVLGGLGGGRGRGGMTGGRGLSGGGLGFRGRGLGGGRGMDSLLGRGRGH